MKMAVWLSFSLLVAVSAWIVLQADLGAWIGSSQMASVRQPGDRGTWLKLASMPSAQQKMATAVLDGKIIVIGGYNQSGVSTSTVVVYDPVKDHWSGAPSLPIVTDHNGAAVASGCLYAFGRTSNRVFAYDPRQDTWSDVAPMRFQHGKSAGVGVMGDRIYVAGGTDTTGATIGAVEVYDPTANSWSTLAPMNVPRHHTAGGVIA
jgi:N-acetylneuraminic acid mutarotase